VSFFICRASGLPASEKRYRVELGATIRVGRVRSVVLSPRGDLITVAPLSGGIRWYSISGESLGCARPEGFDTGLVSPGGELALFYSYRHPYNTRVIFTRPSGEIFWQRSVSGAVWCAAAGEDQDGPVMAVGTGKGYIYIFRVSDRRKRYVRWRLKGAIVSLDFDSDSKSVFHGTWHDSFIGRYTLRGCRLWRMESTTASLQYVEALTEKNRLFVVSTPNVRGRASEYTLFTAGGRILREGIIGPEPGSRIVHSPNGDYICRGYHKLISHKNKSVREKHAVLYDSTGAVVWDKGSLIMPVCPVLVTRRGTVLVTDGNKSLYFVERSGDVRPSIELPSRIVSSIGARDASKAVFYCADGRLRVVHVRR